jgi:WD40 repeat protein
MGVVTVVHDRWLERNIAVKVPHHPDDTQRLLREARVTAGLDHPGIVAVYDTGLSTSGEPWFAMRLVRGRSLAHVLAEHRSDPTSAQPTDTLLRHVLAAAEAVGFANAHGVVHRDLKPANIMVGPFGETQVIDWGLALVDHLDSPDPGRAGTASAMSPEQARGERVDARTDVYALGAILREVVTRRPLFPPSMTRHQVLGALSRNDRPKLPITADIPPELQAVIACAMHPDPARRYADAKALADDLARYLEGRRVAVHTYTPKDLLARVWRAWKLPIALALCALTIVVLTLAVAVAEITSERDLSELTLGRTLVTNAELALHQDDRGQAEILAIAALRRGDFPEARGVLAALPKTRPTRLEHTFAGCEIADISAPTTLSFPAPSPRILCRTPASVAVREGSRTLWERSLETTAAVFLDHGRALVIQRNGLALERLNATTGAPLGELPASCQYARLEASPDGRSALLQNTGCARHINVDTQTPLPLAACREPLMRAIALSSDGHHWAGVCGDGGVVTGLLGSQESNRYETGFPVSPSRPLPSALAFINERSLLMGDSDGGLNFVDLDHPARRRRLVLHDGRVRAIHVSPERQRALVHYESGAPYLVDLQAWSSLGRLPPRSPSRYQTFAFSPDGRIQVANGGRFERWDFDATPVRELRFPEGITDLAVSVDGRHLAIGHGAALSIVNADRRSVVTQHTWQSELMRTVAFVPATTNPDTWSVIAAGLGERGARGFASDGTTRHLPFDRLVRKAVALSDGRILVTDFSRKLWVLAADAGPCDGPPTLAHDHAASLDRRHLAVLDTSHQLWLGRDWLPGRPLVRVGSTQAAPTAHAAHMAHAAHTIAGLDAHRIFLVEPHGVLEVSTDPDHFGHPLARYASATSELVSGTISPELVAAGGRDGSIWVWRRGQPRPLAIVRDHDRRVDRIALDPSSRWLVGGDWDGRVLFIDTEPMRREHVLLPDTSDASRAWGLGLEDLIPNR